MTPAETRHVQDLIDERDDWWRVYLKRICWVWFLLGALSGVVAMVWIR